MFVFAKGIIQSCQTLNVKTVKYLFNRKKNGVDTAESFFRENFEPCEKRWKFYVPAHFYNKNKLLQKLN